MSPDEKEQYKIEVKRALFKYLEMNGLMEAPNAEIMGRLPNMYRFLETEGLIRHGLTFAFFQQVAHEQFVTAVFRGIE